MAKHIFVKIFQSCRFLEFSSVIKTKIEYLFKIYTKMLSKETGNARISYELHFNSKKAVHLCVSEIFFAIVNFAFLAFYNFNNWKLDNIKITIDVTSMPYSKHS